MSAVTIAILCSILVPFFFFEEQLTQWSTETLLATDNRIYGVAIVAILLASDIVLPIPSSIVSILAARLLGFLPSVCAIWLGMTASAAFGYFLGSKGTQILPDRMAVELAQLEHALRKHGWLVLAATRSIPVLAEATAILAGTVRYDFWRFFQITAGSNIGIAFLYSLLGNWTGGEGNYIFAVLAGILVPFLMQIFFRRIVT